MTSFRVALAAVLLGSMLIVIGFALLFGHGGGAVALGVLLLAGGLLLGDVGVPGGGRR